MTAPDSTQARFQRRLRMIRPRALGVDLRSEGELPEPLVRDPQGAARCSGRHCHLYGRRDTRSVGRDQALAGEGVQSEIRHPGDAFAAPEDVDRPSPRLDVAAAALGRGKSVCRVSKTASIRPLRCSPWARTAPSSRDRSGSLRPCRALPTHGLSRGGSRRRPLSLPNPPSL